MGLRGSTIHIQGSNRDVELVERVLHELIDALQFRDLSSVEMARAARTLRSHPQMRLRALLDDVVLTTSNRRIVSPKGVTQQSVRPGDAELRHRVRDRARRHRQDVPGHGDGDSRTSRSGRSNASF